MVSHGVHTELNRVRFEESFSWRRTGRLWFLAFFPSPFLGALTFTLYNPSWLILALHLLVRQVLTSVLVPSVVPLCFLLVTMIEITLSRRLFSLTWLRRWRVHLMRRGRIHPEPVSHRTPTWVPFYSHLLQGACLGVAFNETLLFPLKSWSAEDRVILGCSPRHFGLSPFVLDKYPPRHRPRVLIERGPDHKFPDPT